MDEKRIARFWKNVDRRGPDECWEWQKVRDKKGYGRVRIGGLAGKTMFTHRVSLIIAGTNPAGLMVCHKCDNPPCCNPAHLFLGTTADNFADMASKGRGVPPPLMRGARNPKASLTDEQVREIRAQRLLGVPSEAVAFEYGVSKSTVARITNRSAWRHII